MYKQQFQGLPLKGSQLHHPSPRRPYGTQALVLAGAWDGGMEHAYLPSGYLMQPWKFTKFKSRCSTPPQKGCLPSGYLT
jgi:hypothetical protein